VNPFIRFAEGNPLIGVLRHRGLAEVREVVNELLRKTNERMDE
jgi:hypothetical protein